MDERTGFATLNIRDLPVLDAGGRIYSHFTVQGQKYLNVVHPVVFYNNSISTGGSVKHNINTVY
jgi:hypothetical protein